VPASRLALLVALLACATARAQDPFEIQVYDAETAAPGEFGLEAHLNYVVTGVKTTTNGELPTDNVTHLALEPHIGLASWTEVGAYVQVALQPDGGFGYGGVKLRWKVRLPRRVRGLLGFALNVELGQVPPAYEAGHGGVELRPIFDLKAGRFYLSINPIIGFDFAGGDAGFPQFEPEAAMTVRLFGTTELGVEYYGAIGPIHRPAPAAEQVHRLFGIVNYVRGAFGIQLGIGYGFAGGDKWIVKSILAFTLPESR
jgi:hypothetical protein